jgi:hypothetical protein
VILKNGRVLAGAYDISGISNMVSVGADVEVKDVTCFGNTGRTYAPGLLTTMLEGAGYGTEADMPIRARLALNDTLISIFPEGAAVGDAGYALGSTIGQYDPLNGGRVGEPIDFTWKAWAQADLLNGLLLATGTKGKTAAFFTRNGSGGSSFTVTVDEPGTGGNAYDWAIVTAGGPDAALSAAFSMGLLTITLGTDASGAPDPNKNTVALIAAAVTALSLLTATSSGIGSISTPATGDFAGGSNDAIGTGFVIAGGVPSGKRLWGGLHATALFGTSPTLDVIIQSAATGDSTFASPTTRLTFTQMTAIGAQLISAAGPITDTRFRLKATLGGSVNPRFTIFGWIAIG